MILSTQQQLLFALNPLLQSSRCLVETMMKELKTGMNSCDDNSKNEIVEKVNGLCSSIGQFTGLFGDQRNLSNIPNNNYKRPREEKKEESEGVKDRIARSEQEYKSKKVKDSNPMELESDDPSTSSLITIEDTSVDSQSLSTSQQDNATSVDNQITYQPIPTFSSSVITDFITQNAIPYYFTTGQGICYELSLLSIMNSINNIPGIHRLVDVKLLNRNETIINNSTLVLDSYYLQTSTKDVSLTGDYNLILCDNSIKKMGVLTFKSLSSPLIEMDCSGMRENVIIDLNAEGRRWEGGELNGKPFGYGQEYSENDNLVYEGFMFEGEKVGFGKEWNDDGNNNCLVYEGGFCNDERCGKGISYDLNGNVDFEGEWMNNCGITNSEKHEYVKSDWTIPMTTEFIIFNSKMLDGKNICNIFFSSILHVKQIIFGDSCCQKVPDFVIDGLPNLMTVKIGERCFMSGDRGRNGLFRIMNCPNLRQLEIGNRSFNQFRFFKLTNVNSLQSITFGNSCFDQSDIFLDSR